MSDETVESAALRGASTRESSMHRQVGRSALLPETSPASRARRWAVGASVTVAAVTALAAATASPAWADPAASGPAPTGLNVRTAAVQVPVQACGNNIGSGAALGIAGSGRADHGGNNGHCHQTQTQSGQHSGAGVGGLGRLLRLLGLLQGSCSPEGAMRVHGTGFDTCTNGKYVYRDCAPGTVSRQTGPDTIICDTPSNP